MSVKRYELMACDEHSCHCDVVESAEGDMVDYDDYAALEARCAELAAENAGIKEYLAPVGLAVEGIPATEAFLAEVRASGVEMFAAHKRERQQALRSRNMRMSEEAAGMAADAENFADELRKGVQS
ncbi:hypothetical protein O8E95_001411 [Enterobacter quasiroggenkampii]